MERRQEKTWKIKMNKLEKELEIAKRTAKEAGRILLARANDDLEVSLKEDKSLVTKVDKEASRFITKKLTSNFPDYGILDEENPEDSRKKNKLCWVVDPLDGTIEYVNRRETYGVMIALMEDYSPVLGVVYIPKKDELIYAVKGRGAYIENGSSKKRINVSDNTKIDVLVTDSRKDNPEMNELIKKIKPDSITNMPSAIKIVEVAKGNYNLFLCPKSVIMSLWDLCAGHIILEEAGGKLTDLNFNKIDYAGELRNKNGVIGITPKIIKEVERRLGSLEKNLRW